METNAPRFRSAVLFFSFATGATSLALGMLWIRMLCAVFGSTPPALGSVLAALMLGLILGAPVLGRMADRSGRPLLLYAYLEIAVGLYALAFPLIVAGMSAVYIWLYRAVEPGFFSLTAIRFGMSLVLLPGGFLMGGALPVLGRFLCNRSREPGREVTHLCGAAMIGAVVGCFVSSFLLVQAIGVRGTLVGAACTAIAAGLLALGFGRIAAMPTKNGQKRAESISRHDDTQQAISGRTFRLLLAAFGITGFCLLACKVLWTRILVHTLTASAYSSATILTIFLMGIAIGICLSARFIVPRVRRGLLWFGAVQMLAGLAVLISLALLRSLPAIHSHLLSYGSGAWQFYMMQFAETSAILLVPAILTGAALAIGAAVCFSGDVAAGRRIGLVCSAQMIGCIFGWLLAAFFLLPVLGTQYSLAAVAAVSLAGGVFLIAAAGVRPVRLCIVAGSAVAVVGAAALLVMPSNLFYDKFNTHDDLTSIRFLKESAAGTVTVHDLLNGERLLTVDGIDLGGSDITLRTIQKLQAYIPLFLHANPKRVMQIGFGCGETTRVGLEFGIEDYTIIEPHWDVFEAGKHFEQINHGSYRDPRLRKIRTDGKSFALLCGETFDIIISDSLSPGLGGNSALFTSDHFGNCRQLLGAEGLFACRIPLELQPAELCTILAGFQEIFGHTSAWVASNCLSKHVLLIGSSAPLQIDLKRMTALLRRPAIAKDLAAIEIHNVYDLLDCHLCDDSAVGRILADFERHTGLTPPANTDDNPSLAFGSIRRPGSGSSGREALSMLITHRTPITTYAVRFADEQRDSAQLRQRYEATRYIFEAQISEFLGLARGRRQRLEMALKANPEEVHVLSCEAELERRIRDLRQAAEAMPHSDAIAQRLADKLFIALRYPEAAQIYERLVGLESPPSPRAFVNFAEIRFRDGKTAQAEGLLRRCLDIWPASAEAHDRLGGIYFRMGRMNAARHHAGQALLIEPGNALYLQHFEETAKAR